MNASAIIAAILRLIADQLSNVLIVVGLACVSLACWWLHPSAGLASVGVALFVIGYGSTIKAKAK